jgi:pSer/pThr/pTyr-binding forkhead associated (FHA) protein
VPFTLRVSQSGGEAEDFSFEGGEVRLGRTADNDIVIKDPSSSRSHARVYEEDGRYFVEDLKSANGTRLNGKAVKAPLELNNGDRVMIGDVTLEFGCPESNDTMMAPPSSTVDEAASEEEEDPNATMLKPPTSKPVAPSRPSGIVRKPPPRKNTPPPEEDEAPADDEPAEDVGDSTKNFDVPLPKALQRRPAGTPARASRAVGGGDEPVALSAAERARQRRELQKSSVGRAQLLWSDLSKPAQIAVGLVGSLAIIAGLGLVVMAVMPKRVAKKVEPVELVANGEPIAESFGEGDDVDFPRSDQKSFTFTSAAPTSIVGVLHYQARDCAKDEVTIELNGSSVGTIPPDTVEVATRQLEVVLPSAQLKVNEPNELVFDNVNNPPAEDTWRVWNIWVEVIPIPQMSAEEASRRAKEDIERASRQYELRDVGAMNLFRSWKQYRDAWLLLEATPDRPADLLNISRTRMREIRPELDRKCSAMLVDYQKEMTQKYPNITAARKVLQNIPAHFEKEHPCYGMSRFLLRGLDDLSGSEE